MDSSNHSLNTLEEQLNKLEQLSHSTSLNAYIVDYIDVLRDAVDQLLERNTDTIIASIRDVDELSPST